MRAITTTKNNPTPRTYGMTPRYQPERKNGNNWYKTIAGTMVSHYKKYSAILPTVIVQPKRLPKWLASSFKKGALKRV